MIKLATLATVSVLAIVVLTGPTARAAELQAGSITIEEVTAWVPAEGDYAVKLRVPSNSGGQILTSIYEPLVTTNEVDITATGRGLGRREYRLKTQEWMAGTGSVVIRIPVTTVDRQDGRIRLDAAVYSVVLDIEPDEGEGQRFVTHLRHLAAEPAPRTAAVVVALDAPLGISANGQLGIAGPNQAATFAEDLANIAAFPEALTSLSLPAVLSRSDPTSQVSTDLTRVARQSPFLVRSYAPLEAQVWLDGGLMDLLTAQFDAGTQQLGAVSNVAPANIWAVQPTDSTSLLDWLVARGVNRFLLPSDPAEPQGAPLRIKGLDASHIAIRTADVSLLPGEAGVLAADRILSRLTVGALDDRDLDTPVVVSLGAAHAADHRLTATLLGALGGTGAFRPRAVAEVFGVLQQSSELPRTVDLVPTRRALTSELSPFLVPDTAKVASYAQAVGPDDPTLTALAAMVLASGAAGLDPTAQETLSQIIAGRVTDGLQVVDVANGDPITITSHRATVPLRLRNRSDRALTVMVDISSNELTVESGNPQLLLLDAGRTIDLEVTVRVARSGDFALDVHVTTPDGLLTVAGPTTVTLRSSAISGLGLIISLSALAFLLIWWFSHSRASRHTRAKVMSHRALNPIPLKRRLTSLAQPPAAFRRRTTPLN